MPKYLENIIDSFELKISKRECKELKDSVEDDGKRALIVKLKATHGGYINGNKFNYQIDSMQDATKSWVEPFKKPVLVHHDDLSDPIGRVIDSEFVPMSTNRRDKPKGFIQLKLRVTDQEAVEKILDGRYMTVSVGSSPESAVCSICDRNLILDGPCNHKRGTIYDNKMCFWDIRVKKYNEVSFVNKPADEYQRGIESTEFADNENTEDSLNLDTDTYKVEFYLEDKETNKDINNDKESKNMDKEEELKVDTVDGTWTQDDLDMMKWLMDEMEKEIGDAKLSTEARKKLSSGTFCGPNRSFPVNDCAHYTAAKRLIGKYKGPGDKSRILACVERRGKSLGCTNKDNQEPGDKKVEITKDELTKVQTELAELKVKYDALVPVSVADKAKITELEAKLVDKNKEIDQINDQLIRSKALNHEILINKIYDLRVKLGKSDIKDLKDEQIKTYKEGLAKRSDDSLNDTLVDLEKEIEIKDKPKEPETKVTKDSLDTKDEKQTKIENTETITIKEDLGDILKNRKK